MSPAPRRPEEGKRSLVQRALDAIFGYDFFISYTRRDGGKEYAEALARRLKKNGFQIFFDSDDYAMGDDWKIEGRWALRRTSQLILIASPEALSAPAVVHEVEIYSSLPRRQVIPIDFGGTIRHRDETKPVFKHLTSQILFIEERVDRLGGEPSDEVLKKLRDGFNLKRQDKKRATIFGLAALGLFVLTVAAGAAAWIAVLQTKQAKAETREANRLLGGARWNSAEHARDRDTDSIRAAHQFAAAGSAFERAEEPTMVKGAAIASLLAIKKSPLIRVFPEARGAAFAKKKDWLLTWNESVARLWDARVGCERPRQTFEHAAYVDGACFTTDETRVLTWGGDTARLWTIGSERQEPPRTFDHVKIRGAVFSKDEGRLLTWGGNMARLWKTSADSKNPDQSFELKSEVWGASFTKDESQLLAWSTDGTAQLWKIAGENKASSQVFENAEPHGEDALSGSEVGALLSKDEKWVLTWAGSTALLWETGKDARTPSQILRNPVTPGPAPGPVGGAGGANSPPAVIGAAFTSDEKHVLTWSRDGTARLWEIGMNRDEPLWTFSHESIIHRAVLTKDGTRMITLGYDCTARLWDVGVGDKEPRLIHEFAAPSNVDVLNGSMTAVFTDDGHTVLIAGADGTARVWAIGESSEEPRLVKSLDGDEAQALFNEGGSKILTFSGTNALLWKSGDGGEVPLRTFQNPQAEGADKPARVRGAVFTKDANHLLTWSDDDTARLWDVSATDGAPSRIFKHKGLIGAAFTEAEKRVLTWSGEDGSARLWEIGNDANRPLQSFTFPGFSELGPYQEPVFSNANSRVLIGGKDGRARLWQISENSKQPLETFAGDPAGQSSGATDGATYSADETQLITWNGNVAWLWQVGRVPKQPILTIRDDRDGGGVRDAVFSKDGTRVLALSGMADAVLWEIRGGSARLVRRFGDRIHQVSGATFTGDEKGVLTWTSDYRLRWWKIDQGAAEPFQSFGYKKSVTETDNKQVGAVFTREKDRVLMFRSRDKVARLWAIGVDSGEPLQSFEHVEPIMGANFTPDESRVLTWSEDGTARLWDTFVDPATTAAQATLEVELTTAATSSQGEIQPLSFDAWLAKRRELDEIRARRKPSPKE